ncbi:MAG TPA: alpha/beta hydrolase-fold protein [Spirochaetota bacterium]|nr:alpha/beta hydrolase-fold protein [Spirochaetota bacterium]HPI89104.1 alpha/beta hydrolase-fold protein [Spirochaetota bacterium]HPR48858.1 alpha/beta hydrolase-fold protein [Spirochaetota bacterium]
MNKKFYCLIILLCIIALPLGGKDSPYKSLVRPGKWLRNIKVPLGVEDRSVTVQIYFPASYTGKERTLIGLHGYAGSAKDIEENTSITRHAEEYNFIIVCPDMGRTMYESQFYPETEIRWSPVPGAKFIAEILIPFLKDNFGIARRKKSTGIFGISTGGRGAILLASLYPDIFGAAAGISGDYDPLSMTHDRLLKTVYGNYDSFRERWENDDNILKLCENLKKTSVMLVHGAKDYITPREQSLVLAMKLKQLQKKSGGYDFQYLEKKHQARDWKFWKGVLIDVMAFFSEKLT